MASAARRVVRSSLGEQVTEALRDMILTGEFMPGEFVTHDDLAKRLGVSTMPVREALLRLTHEGFIDAKHGRSFRIVSTTREDIQDVYWLHALLAGELTARACTKGTAELVRELNEIQDRWENVANGDVNELETLNFRFHRAINRAAESPKLLRLLRSTIRQIPERFYALLPAWKDMSTEGHREVLEAIEARDPDAARKAAEDHIRDAGALLIGHFNVNGYWAEPSDEAVVPA